MSARRLAGNTQLDVIYEVDGNRIMSIIDIDSFQVLDPGVCLAGAHRVLTLDAMPSVVREVKPAYTADAMRAKVQGSVWLECIVMPDGTVGDVKVTRSLDPIFGLDQEAIKAAKQWRFRPGMRQGEPVPVIITIELTFTLR